MIYKLLNISRILFFVVISFNIFNIRSQGFTVDIQTSISNPSLGKVNKIFEDSRGIIWIGTDLGLIRESAGSFTTIDSKNGFIPNTVNDIYEDNQKRLWFCTNNGIFIYDGFQFQPTKINIKNKLFTPKILRILPFDEGSIYVCSNLGLLRISRLNNTILEAEQISQNSCYNGVISENKLLLSSEAGIFSIELKNRTIKKLNSNFSIRQLSVMKFVRTKKAIYMSSNDLFTIINNNCILLKKNIHPNYIGPLHAFENSIIFGDFQMYEYKESDKTFSMYDMGAQNITNIAFSKDSSVLVGGFGVFARFRTTYWYEKTDSLKHYGSPMFRYSSFSKNVYQIDRANHFEINQLNKIGTDNYFQNIKVALSEIEKSKIGEIADWIFIKNGDIVFTTYSNGFYVFKNTTNKNIQIAKFANYYPGARFGSITHDTLFSNSIIITGENTIVKLDSNLNIKETSKINLNSELIRVFYFKDEQIKIVLNGIIINKSTTGDSYLQDEFNLPKIPILRHFIEYEKSRIWWITTNGHILCVEHKGKNNFQLLVNHKPADLFNTFSKVTNFVRLTEDLLLISNFNQGFIFNTKTTPFKVQYIDTTGKLRDFFQFIGNNIIHDNSIYSVSSKRLFQYKYNLNFLINSIKQELSIPTLLNLQIGEKSISNFILNQDLKEKIITYEDKNIKLNIIPVVFNTLHKPFLEYFLKGFEDSWSNITYNDWIEYRKLPPGDYEFICRVGGSFNSQIIRIPISILPPWYKQKLTLIIFGILLIFLGFSIAKLIFNKTVENAKKNQKLAEYEKTIIESKLRYLRAQIEPHFISNALQSAKLNLLKHDFERSQTQIDNMSKIFRSFFEMSENSWISISDEAHWLAEYCRIESDSPIKNIKITHNFDQFMEFNHLLIPSMLIQPIIENAFKHGLDKNSNNLFLEIKLSMLKNNKLRFDIRDSGKNIFMGNISNKKNLSGYKVTMERIKLLNNILSDNIELIFLDNLDQSEILTGTWVRLDLPFQNKIPDK